MNAADAAPDRRRSYHHGSLRSALIEAGVALAREGGPDRVILREAARAAGVSHSAAYRHFSDREALLTEVSRCARGALAARMRLGVDRATDPLDRLAAVGSAYVGFALAEPGLFRTAFDAHPFLGQVSVRDNASRDEGVHPEEPSEILEDVLDQVLSAGLMPADRRPGAAIAAWSAVHGLAALLVDGPLPTTPAEVDFAMEQVLTLIGRGLLSVPDES